MGLPIRNSPSLEDFLDPPLQEVHGQTRHRMIHNTYHKSPTHSTSISAFITWRSDEKHAVPPTGARHLVLASLWVVWQGATARETEELTNWEDSGPLHTIEELTNWDYSGPLHTSGGR